MIKTSKKEILSTVSAYGRNTAGNFALMTALSLTIVVGAVGAGVDLSGVVSEKSRLQDITDSAALAAAASGETKEAEIRIVVDEVMKFHADEMREFEYNLVMDQDNIKVSANAVYQTAIMSMIGYKNIPISTKSGAPVPKEVPAHVALVLDTTDSMAGANLTSLQDAAGELVKIVERGKSSGAKMSVVPFGNYVNIGMGNRSAGWMDVPADFTETSACYMYRPVRSVSGCSAVTRTRYNDGVPEDFEAQEGCVYEYEDDEVEYCPAPRDVQWNGCAGSRNAPLNITAAANGSTRIPGAMGVSCGSEILPLTDDFGDVEDAIDDLTTRGNTYLPTGLIWGWRTLTEQQPLANAAITDKTVRAVIFMTDGGNTMNQWDKDGTGDIAYHRTIAPDDTAENKQASDRMLAICDGIKSDGITIYTVGYKLPSGAAGDKADLAACASSSSTAFEAKNSKELKDAFKDIGKALATVRLTF